MVGNTRWVDEPRGIGYVTYIVGGVEIREEKICEHGPIDQQA